MVKLYGQFKWRDKKGKWHKGEKFEIKPEHLEKAKKSKYYRKE